MRLRRATKTFAYIAILLIGGFVLIDKSVVAQEQPVTGDTTIGIAQELVLNEVVENGSIISYANQVYSLSNKEYDDNVFGVVNSRPALSFGDFADTDRVPVVTSGLVTVRVSNQDGDISTGDLITTSEVAGVGKKAVNSGYILGTAMQNATFSDDQDVQIIRMQLSPRFWINPDQSLNRDVQRSLTDIFSLSSIAAEEQPIIVFRYVVAALIVIASFAIGFITFGRVARNGIEAIGRNPLAGRLISISIFFNVLITIAIIVAGLFIGYLVITV